MRGFLAALLLLLSFAQMPAGTSLGEEPARKAALRFGQALTEGDTSLLHSILPDRGKVQMKLICFGPEQGSFSASQVEALLMDFLRQGVVRSFELERMECVEGRYAVARARAKVTNREGAPDDVELHLTFQPEGDRWVLREIRESPP